jgi:hypothetical protein
MRQGISCFNIYSLSQHAAHDDEAPACQESSCGGQCCQSRQTIQRSHTRKAYMCPVKHAHAGGTYAQQHFMVQALPNLLLQHSSPYSHELPDACLTAAR